MKSLPVLALAAVLPMLGPPALRAQFDYRLGRNVGVDPTGEKRTYIYVPTAKTLSQSLTDEAKRLNRDVKFVTIHALLPDGKGHACIASTGRPEMIGDADDATDLLVSERQFVLIDPRLQKKQKECIIALPLETAAGIPLRAELAIVFFARPGDYRPKFLFRAIAIRDEMARQISGLADLFEPPR